MSCWFFFYHLPLFFLLHNALKFMIPQHPVSPHFSCYTFSTYYHNILFVPVLKVGDFWHCFYWLTDNLLQFVIFLHVSVQTSICVHRIVRCNKSMSVCFECIAKDFHLLFWFSPSFMFFYYQTFCLFFCLRSFNFFYYVFILSTRQNTWFLVKFFQNWSKVVLSSWDYSLKCLN